MGGKIVAIQQYLDLQCFCLLNEPVIHNSMFCKSLAAHHYFMYEMSIVGTSLKR